MSRMLAKLGNKTTHGCIISATSTMFDDGDPLVKSGDMAWCDTCKGAFPIVGTGCGWFDDDPMVANGDKVMCRCPNHQVCAYSNMLGDENEGFFSSKPNPRAAPTVPRYDSVDSSSVSPSASTLATPASSPSILPSSEPAKAVGAAEPGFHIVERTMSRSALESLLFDQPTEGALKKFASLNPHLTGFTKPGQMLVLSDPQNTQCTHEEALLMQAAEKVEAALALLSEEEAAFMTQNHDVIESFLTQGSTAIGIGTAMFGKHLEGLTATLKEIEDLHKRTFLLTGKLQSTDFFAERKRLMAKLDNHLGPLVRKGVGMPNHPKLKAALGISTKSLVHHWNKAGSVAGGISGYSTHIEGVAKASKFIKYGGVAGIALGAGASALKVQETCRAGREDECTKVRFIESGKFAGAVVGGGLGAEGGFLAAGIICPAFAGLAGVGAVVCVVVVVGAGAGIGGVVGELRGEELGEVLYEGMRQ